MNCTKINSFKRKLCPMSTNHGARFQNIEQNQGSTLRLAHTLHYKLNYAKWAKHVLRSSVCCKAAIKHWRQTAFVSDLHRVHDKSKWFYTVDRITNRLWTYFQFKKLGYKTFCEPLNCACSIKTTSNLHVLALLIDEK